MSKHADAVERSLAHAFAEAGKSLYLVGGPVRDSLLDRSTSTDFDYTTDAEPNEIKRYFRRAGADHIYSVGERFGTIGGVFGDYRAEITTYRSESYTPGSRKPRVAFDTTLEGDLARRDFTINAMARPADGNGLIDPFGGRADLEARVIRAVGDADERFTEDPLRLLRAVRFAAQLGFEIEPATWAAIRRNAPKLANISMERISQEFTRTLMAERPSQAVRALADLGLMEHFLPEFLALKEPHLAVAQDGGQARRPRYKDIFEHTLLVLDRTPSVLNVRLGALLHDIGKPKTMSMTDEEVHFYGHEAIGERMARRILSRLRLDRDTVERVALIISLSGRVNAYEGEWTDGAVRRIVREASDPSTVDELLLLSHADVTSAREERVRAAERRVDDLRARIEQLQAEEDIAKIKPPIDGNDLMVLFDRPPGPWIRPIKERLLTMVLDGELASNDRERAEAIARAMVAEMEPAPPR